MQTEEILAAISKQIADLQRAYDLLAGTVVPETPAVRRGRPKGSTNKPAAAPAKVLKRGMSAEGKARIAAAQKKRWAALKKATKPAAKKATAKKSPAKKTSVKTKATNKTAAVEQQAG